MKEKAEKIYEIAQAVRYGLGSCRSVYSSNHIYNDEYIEIDSGYSFSIWLKDKDRTKVFDATEQNHVFSYSVFRPGQWVSHLETLYKKSKDEKANKKEKEELIDSLRFASIDDSSLFSAPQKKTQPEEEQPTVSERLEELLREIMQEEIYYHSEC